MRITNLVRALVAAGASGDVILAAVEAAEADQMAEIDRRRMSDAERQRRHREKLQMSRDEDVTERDTKAETGISATPAFSAEDLQAAVTAYNKAAAYANWPKVAKLTDTRRRHLRARLEDAGGVEGWTAALRRAVKAPHLRGENSSGWVANFDFFLQASSFLKLLEGAYDARTPVARPNGSGRPSAHDTLAAAVGSVFGLGDGDEGRRVVEERDQPRGPSLDFEASGGARVFAFR